MVHPYIRNPYCSWEQVCFIYYVIKPFFFLQESKFNSDREQLRGQDPGNALKEVKSSHFSGYGTT